MNTLQSALQQSVPNGTFARQRQNTPTVSWTLAAPYALLGLALVGTVCVLALLLAFRQVVLEGVQQGESRNRAIATYAEGIWRCKALRAVGERAACRVQLDAAQATAPVARGRGNAPTAMAVAHDPQ